ncbi:cell division protein FtsZ [Aureimonas jatrophae]|uniref:Cell division protein FtsZ n=1 Tax=Aureimonas jatrophae TaxID=1166073 RepID=A0A1H0CEJ6_9HYPH|nr:cell division protein FtsZ [Aureimonas jatrophae]MBB3949198.1 cell division protein FtsZ [Aureimonas jatrophae]SDN56246.1 cell division protein FtsZ [Aureimonas jatrophae]
MSITLQRPDITELKPRITVFGVGGGGCNAVNNMINAGLEGVEFVIANTDAQALRSSRAERIIQMGVAVTEGLGAGSQPEVGRAAAEESLDEICDHLLGSHMCFVTAGMGGGTGTGAAPVVARAAREKGILTVGVVTKPFHFEGQRRLRIAEQGIEELQKNVDTLIVIPNQNLFRIANDKTTFADAFGMADQVLYSGVACITDLMVKEGLINLDFADVRSVMREMGKAMMGTGEASGEGRAMAAAEAAIANPLLDETSMKGAKGLLISITGGRDLTLFEVDEAATRIREEVDQDANIILGATFDESLEGVIRVSVVATGIDKSAMEVYNRNAAAAPVAAQAAQPAPVAAPAPALRAAAPQPAAQQAPVQPAAPAYEPAPAVATGDIEDDFTLALEAEIAQVAPRAPAPRQPVQQPAQARMPRVEDFPPVVQAEIERRSGGTEAASSDGGPMGLLRRLTTGLSRREEDEGILSDPVRPAARPAARQPEHNPYAPRRQAADSAARPPRAAGEEDQLEIPAFLRRQSN